MQRHVDAARDAKAGIHEEAHDHADDDLRADDFENDVGRHLLGDEDGQHLVRRREEHREQRSQRDDAPSPQRRGSRGEAALGHYAHDGTDERPCRAGALNGSLGLPTRLMLKPLHGQIRDEQKRNDVKRVLDRVCQHVKRYMHDFFHNNVL